MEGWFNGGIFALPVWGAYIWRGLYMEGLIFRIHLQKNSAVVNWDRKRAIKFETARIHFLRDVFAAVAVAVVVVA